MFPEHAVRHTLDRAPRGARLLLFALVTLASSGCEEDTLGPSRPNLRVSVSTIGVDRDSSYLVRAGDGAAHPLLAVLNLSLPPGDHDVVLEEVAANCAIQGPGSVRVSITPDQVAVAAFQVECRAVTGAIEVAAPASGRDFDPDGLTVHLDEVPRTRVFLGGSVVLDGLPPGTHVVGLDGFSENCGLGGPPTQTVQVTAGGLTRDTVRATFVTSCQAVTGDVQLLTATAGADTDPNGYTLVLDGQLVIEPCGFYDYYCHPGAPLMLAPNGDAWFPQLPAGDHTYELGDIAPNCTVNGSNPRTVPVAAGVTSVALFELTCHDLP